VYRENRHVDRIRRARYLICTNIPYTVPTTTHLRVSLASWGGVDNPPREPPDAALLRGMRVAASGMAPFQLDDTLSSKPRK
jgi:hypothetical protein